MMDEWLEIVRREAGVVAGGRHHKVTLVATGYNPDTHAVKGILMPHGVETGWVPIATQSIGNGFGIAVGPTVGTADDLKGDQFDLDFESGDPNTPVAKGRLFSTSEKPPRVESGEIIIKHKDGSTIFLDKGKNLTLTGPTGKTNSVKLGADGTITQKASEGVAHIMHPDNGHSFTFGGTTLTFDAEGKIKHDGKDIGKTHKHGGVIPGGGDTDVPSN